ncbi:RNA polymerase sigma-70 factor [Dyadobacter pollutisoli]|uniref:RNA polymerase sigma-70 factor n=1 Tax=Dyadobacter pollutisoli TaxID=2910158 RepID=A0A9E8NIQ0_9BACT|nr:RNA polymerase sigma-70 factor [Dyadobacter pollutisoli]WAC14754.1 RNA polymerase sigma-70 factor [Dyadobacter pollutisoli]
MAINSIKKLPSPSAEKDSIDLSVQDNGSTMLDDEYLIRKTFSQDPQKGCELLFRKYYTNLCNHAIRFVHSSEVAEDIVSEVFAAFWQSRTFELINTSYRAYLYKSVRNRSYNYLKWDLNRTSPMEVMTTPFAAHALNPCEALQYSELHQQVERIVQDMPPQCRKAYLLKRVEGKSLEEIAAELQITPKSVEALITRAIARLRNGLKDSWFICLALMLSIKI